MFELFQLPLAMGADPVTIAIYALYAIAIGYSYAATRQAQKAAKRASQAATAQRARGALYQVRGGALPRRLVYGRHRVGGIEFYVNVSGASNEYLHYVLGWAEGPCEEVEQLLFDGNEVPLQPIDESNPDIKVATSDSPYFGTIRFESELGDNLLPPPHGAGIIPVWGDNPQNMLVGICYSWLELKYDPDIYPTGVPNLGAVLKGRNDIWDPRIDDYIFTDNPALCLNHYMTLPSKIGPGLDYATEMGIDELIAAAQACEEQMEVPAMGSGTEATGGDSSASPNEFEDRYSFNGIVELDKDPEEIIDDFRMSMAGISVYIGGKFRIYAGVYQTPTFTITKDMIVGPVSRRTRASKRDRFNIGRGVYANQYTKWVPTDFPALRIEQYVDDDGEELAEDFDLLNSDSPYRAQRIASIFLERSRYSREISVPCNIEAYRAQAGLPVFFDFPEIGYDNVPMDVISMGIAIQGGEIRLVLTLRETNALIYEPPDYKRVPIPDDTNQPLPIPDPPGPTYVDLLPKIKAQVILSCKPRGGTALMIGCVGFTGYSTSNPPKTYRRFEQSGSAHNDYHQFDPTCTAPVFAVDNITYGGVLQHDKDTGVATASGQSVANGVVFPYTSTVCPSIIPSDDCRDVWPVKTETLALRGATNVCCPELTILGSVIYGAKHTSDSLRWEFSDEDMESDAIDRLMSATPPPTDFAVCANILVTPNLAPLACCASWYYARTGLSFPYQETEVRTAVSSLVPGATYLIRLFIRRHDLVAGTSALNTVRELIAVASPGGLAGEDWSMPIERGVKFTIETAYVSLLAPP